MTPDEAVAALAARAVPGKAAEMAAYHKAPRTYLGVANPDINALAAEWRKALSVEERVALADALWRTDIHEARVAAAKVLTQARIKGDEPVWELIASWVSQFDGWAIADHACDAGERRLVADPARIDQVETWLEHPSFWVRRAALVITLPWTKQNHPSAEELSVRDRVMTWCTRLAPDREWFIQKAIAWWLRDLSKHDPERVRAWLAAHQDALKPFARKEASRHLAGG